MQRSIWIFILITLSSFGALNVLYPQEIFNLLIAAGIGVIFSYVDDWSRVEKNLVQETLEVEILEPESNPIPETTITSIPPHIVPRRRRSNAQV